MCGEMVAVVNRLPEVLCHTKGRAEAQMVVGGIPRVPGWVQPHGRGGVVGMSGSRPELKTRPLPTPTEWCEINRQP